MKYETYHYLKIWWVNIDYDRICFDPVSQNYIQQKNFEWLTQQMPM